MSPFLRELVSGLALASGLSALGCAGLIASGESASRHEDAGANPETPATPALGADAAGEVEPADASSIPDVYGAQFQGDADQCATVVCSGAQVCCIVPIPSDAPTEHPDNRCDYNCTAQCMDVCPVIALGPSSITPSSEGGPLHGGAVVLPVDDDGGE